MNVTSLGMITAVGQNDIYIENSEFSFNNFTGDKVCLRQLRLVSFVRAW